ncbi:hypothetical protein FNF31_02455 [Cafeteria roenbergensis]|uniref:Double-strand break repair protein n=1 Tax=Cafeteria roenbergensis TaxID=33653 RepID=A0A5A8DGN7_CAFRO|nr:hypothetical protein FNF31_02455 [Cafeteria roenbergensis]
MAAEASAAGAAGAAAGLPGDDGGDPDMLRILVFTDNHCGFMERDAVRGEDSFLAFEEALRFGRKEGVDFAVNSGDIFHENRPSRYTNHRVLSALRTHCMGSRPIRFELLSDQARHFGSEGKFRRVNYMDPHFNVDMPVFCIHGNHDDPTIDRGDASLGALHVLEAANMVNYFGRQRSVDDIVLEPLLFRKGKTQMALYGLGNMRDERLHAAFMADKVRFMRPTNAGSWVNVLLIHQNREDPRRGLKSCIKVDFIPKFIDLVIWGHEHDSRIVPQPTAGNHFFVSQPGSSVATSLMEGEALPKHIGVLEVKHSRFRIVPHRLRCVRPFLTESVTLAQEPAVSSAMAAERAEGLALDDAMPAGSAAVRAAVQDALEARVEALVRRAAEELAARPADELPPKALQLPLVRVRVEHTGLPALSNKIFGADFAGRVANPGDILLFHKARPKREPRGKAASSAAAGSDLDELIQHQGDGADRSSMTDLLRDTLKGMDGKLRALTDVRLIGALERFVWENDAAAFQEMVDQRLKRLQRNLMDQAHAQLGAGRAQRADSVGKLIEEDTARDHRSWVQRRQSTQQRAKEQSEEALRRLGAAVGVGERAGAATPSAAAAAAPSRPPVADAPPRRGQASAARSKRAGKRPRPSAPAEGPSASSAKAPRGLPVVEETDTSSDSEFEGSEPRDRSRHRRTAEGGYSPDIGAQPHSARRRAPQRGGAAGAAGSEGDDDDISSDDGAGPVPSGLDVSRSLPRSRRTGPSMSRSRKRSPSRSRSREPAAAVIALSDDDDDDVGDVGLAAAAPKARPRRRRGAKLT